MNRRSFLKNNSFISLGLCFGINGLNSVPNLDEILNVLENELTSDDENRKLALIENAIFSNSNLSDDQIMNSFTTNFRINYGERRNGKLTSKTRNAIKDNSPLTFDEVVAACNYQNNASLGDFLPKLTEFGYSALGGFGVSIVAGTVLSTAPVSIPLLATGVGLAGLGVGGASLASYIGDIRKQQNEQICIKTVNDFNQMSKKDQEFITSDEVQNQVIIPFRKETRNLIEENKDSSLLRQTEEKVQNSGASNLEEKQREFLKAYLDALREEHERREEQVKQIQSLEERKKLLEKIERESAENSNKIYLAEVFISKILGDPTAGRNFAKVANSINQMYTSYSKFIMQPPAISTVALSANWVSAGLVIMSVLEGGGNGEAEAWKALFKQLKQLTELVIEGFNSVLKNQQAILERLANIFDLIQTNGIIEQTYLTEIKQTLEGIEHKINKLELDTYMNKIVDSNSQLNTLFGDKSFSLRKDSYRVPFNNFITNYVNHSTLYASSIESLSGYNANVTSAQLIKRTKQNSSLEQQIGLIPVVHRLSSFVNVNLEHNKYEGAIANPIEWSRGVGLYLEAISFGKPKSLYVKNHIKKFTAQGNLLASFARDYSNPNTIKQISNQFHEISTQLASKLASWVTKESNNLGIKTYLPNYLSYSSSNVRKLNRNTFRKINNSGHQKHNWNAERDALRSSFSGKSRKICINEYDGFNNNEPLYTTDLNIHEMLKFLKNRGIIDYSVSSKVANNNYHTKYKRHTIKFKKRFLRGLKITFFETKRWVAGKPHQGPFHPFTKIDFAAGIDAYNNIGTKINSYQWKSKAQQLLNNHSNPERYFLIPSVYPKNHNSSINKFRYNFTDLIVNEVAWEIRDLITKVGKNVSLKKQILFESNLPVSSKMDYTGYLLASTRSLLQYQEKSAPEYAYMNSNWRNIQITSPLLNLPEFSFFEDLLYHLQQSLLNTDFMNMNKNQKWKSTVGLLRQNHNNLKPFETYVTNLLKEIISKQKDTIASELGESTESVNFNLNYTLAMLQAYNSNINLADE